MSDNRFYLRAQRRRWCLSQKDLAALLPSGSRNRVSLVERGIAAPNAREILAYRLIFGAPTRTTFPHFHRTVEDLVMSRAYKMHRRLEGRRWPRAERRRELMEAMLARATRRITKPSV
ncbi:MAG: hypothetical protein ISP45_04125 [Reyranella sp.]|nr:hypothetical protein [Reyranella sp.]MBL6851923.1 hypothetical protein [Alphaproteobacteria bacterium]